MKSREYVVAVSVLLLSALPGLAQTTFPDHCPSGAALPFASIEVKHPIDESCGINGKTTSSANSRLQDSVKNNFCAEGTPETFTPQMLIDLQTNNKIPSGTGKEPSSRSALQKLGEGKLIRMKAYLIEAHYADLPTASDLKAGKSGGESVNCSGSTVDKNDIHIALGPQPDTKECATVSAEISPHFRPASWDQIGNFETFNSSTGRYVANPGMASRLQAHPYRITGQLFFDASHAPCPCGTTCNPSRSSVWEIHPVYSIEVCKVGTPCDENNDADWIAFDTWWKSLAPLQPVPPPHKHAPHETN